jgi:predicted dehydrogenase
MPVTMALAGAGQRGMFAYGPYALEFPSHLRFVAVAEPNPDRRRRFAEMHGIPVDRQYAGWEDMFGKPQLAETALIATPDRLHHAPAKAALESGYDVLVEKPMATTPARLVDLVETGRQSGRLLQVCHVLRYTPLFRELHDAVASGLLGDIVAVSHRENFLYWHMAHSFVRGNWRRADESAPMILAKACHDFDIVGWNLGDPVARLSSYGSLMHFRPENAPPAAPDRCLDGCPAAATCPFDAARLYLDESRTGWPVHVITDDLSPEGRRTALSTGPYGRCVYRCDNDVPDHQVTVMETTSGATISMTVQGHAYEEARTMRYDGTRGTLRAKFGPRSGIEFHDHLTGRRRQLAVGDSAGGHGGGDFGVVRAFLAARSDATAVTNVEEILESHLLALAAEESRRSGRPVDMRTFRPEN